MCDFRIICFFLFLPSAEDELFASIPSEHMSLYWWILSRSLYFTACTLVVTKTCGSSEHFIQKVPIVLFFPHHLLTVTAAGKRKQCSYAVIKTRAVKDMNRSLHNLGFFLPLNTPRNTRNQQEPFFTLILPITPHLSFIFTSSSQLPRHSCNLGDIEQGDRAE